MAGADSGGMGGGGRSLGGGGGGPGEGGGVRTPPTTPKKVGGKMLAVKILMLDDTYTLFQIQSKACASVLLEQVCRQLNLLESDYFGLEYTDGNTRYWLDLEKPMSRQVCLSQVEPVLRFCVKFYTPDPAQLEEEYTRYLFALQIKRDLAHGWLMCNDNTAALMASYIVQAECGDFVEEDYPDHRYLSLYKFVPSQDPELERKIMENHKKHVGMTPAAADLNLLETARRCELYGIKMHPAKDNEGVPLNLAVAHMGVLVFQNYTKINTFSWAKIRKLSFKRKRFLTKLHPEGYGYYKDIVEFFFDGRNECKNFWKKCVEHHGFFRCSQVKKVPRQKTRVLSRGSSFRYSGRTQKQVQEFVRDNYVKRAPFQRSQSFRHSPSVHTSVSNVGMSISAQPLLPLGDNQCIGTPVSLSCGSMTLASTGDPQSPGSPTQTETADLHDFDTRDLETPSVTPSRQDTLSPETSVTSSPQRGHDPEYPHHPGQHRHYQRAPSLDTNSTMSSRQQLNSNPALMEGSIKEYSYVDNCHYQEPADDSGDNLSHESYELIEREGGKWAESQSSSRAPSRSGSKLMINSEIGSTEGLEWAELKGDNNGNRGRASSYTGSLPRSHGSSTNKKQTNGYTGSLPRTHSSSQSCTLSRSLAGSRASSRITLELPLDSRPSENDDEDLASPGSPEFHENSVCEITSEKGYILSTRHLGTITITDTSSMFSQISHSRHSGLERQESLPESISIRSRSSSHSRVGRESRESLREVGDSTSISTMTMTTRLSASMRAAKEMGHYVDYGSSQESLHKMSSCESDGGSSLSSHTRSSTTPRPLDLQHGNFLQHRRSTSTSPPSITSYSSQTRPRCMDFSTLHKKPKFHMYGAGRGSDSGGNTDSDICSPLEIPHPIPPPPEDVREEEEDDDDLTPSQEQVQFLPRPADMDLITRVRGSSDEEEDEQEDLQDLELESEQEDQIIVVIEEKEEPCIFDFEILPPPPEVKEESPSSGEMDLTDTSRERKIDESDASERTVIERFRLPDERLNKLGSKDSQMSIEEIDESILDRRSSMTGERRQSAHDIGRKSPYPTSERRPSIQDMGCISPLLLDRERRSSLHESERKSPYLETDRRSSVHDLGRRSPYERDREREDRERKSSSSSERRSSVCSDRRSSVSSERRGSASSERRPSLSDIGRRTSISIEPGQRSPFFDAPVFEFEPERESDSVEPDTSSSTLASASEKSPTVSDIERKNNFFNGLMLNDSLISMDEFTEALIPPEEAPEPFASISGARVIEIVEGKTDHKVIVTTEPEEEEEEDEDEEDDDEDEDEEEEEEEDDEEVFIKEKVIIAKEDSIQSVETEGEEGNEGLRGREGAVGVDTLVLDEDDAIGAVGGTEEDLDQDYFEDDDEDDHAQMSDQSPQSPDLVSEPDEYHDDYQEPEYYQPFTRQIDIGYAFPSRTLSRISERSTTSEQEHEQDHIGLPEPEPEHTDSKISTPTEEKLPSIPSEEQQGELPSDYSNSTSDDNQSDRRTSLNAEQETPQPYTTQFFLRDLPEFVPGDESDEFPSPPSSAFLENPHTELSHIETYYMEINQRVNQSSEGIYDNIPVKFEGIHEVSESESASEENHTLQEPEDNLEMLDDVQAVEELEEEPGTSAVKEKTTTPKPKTPTRLRKELPSPSPPPPPPPPRPFMRPPSLSRSPSPPLTPPTPIAREMPITKYDGGQVLDLRHRVAIEFEVRGGHLHESRENLSTAGLTAQTDSGEWNSF
nr:uncharacterized protein LOC123757235 isoform X2 [Procambarus clarkii]